ncbi:MAG: zinc-binding dehydrogenase [Candidatus Rokubacteria bacterium]|nr:zinc-binding dehydrogenase [Candidatus Rokubacteria bacterium]
MRAARFYAAGTPLSVEEVPVLAPGPGEVRVEVKGCGICGTDLHIALEGTIQLPKTPITLGHEAAGTVAEFGPGVSGWAAGDRVAIFPNVACGTCYPCREGREVLCLNAQVLGLHRDGAFAESLTLPAACLLALPEAVPFTVGAIAADAVSTAYRAVVGRGALRSGERVAVFGCGGLGIHGIKIARLVGASQIIGVDVAPGALRRARESGATETVDAREGDAAKRVRSLTAGEGVDLALEFVGLKASVTEAVRSLKRGGRAVIAGVGPDRAELPPLRSFVGSELSLLAAMGFTREDVRTVLRLAAEGRLDLASSVTDVIPLAAINDGFRRALAKEGDPIRIVVVP